MPKKLKEINYDEMEREETLAKAKKTAQKEKVKAFLMKVIEKKKQKAKNTEMVITQKTKQIDSTIDSTYSWKSFYDLFKGYKPWFLLESEDKLFVPLLHNPSSWGVEYKQLAYYMWYGAVLLNSYVEYIKKHKELWPSKSKQAIRVGFSHPDMSEVLGYRWGNPEVRGTADDILGDPLEKDIYGNSKYPVFFDFIVSYDVEEEKGEYYPTGVDGARVSLSVHAEGAKQFEEHLNMTLFTNAEEIANNEGEKIGLHYRTEFARSDDDSKTQALEKNFRANKTKLKGKVSGEIFKNLL